MKFCDSALRGWQGLWSAPQLWVPEIARACVTSGTTTGLDFRSASQRRPRHRQCASRNNLLCFTSSNPRKHVEFGSKAERQTGKEADPEGLRWMNFAVPSALVHHVHRAPYINDNPARNSRSDNSIKTSTNPSAPSRLRPLTPYLTVARLVRMEDFSTYLTSTPPELQSQSSAQPSHPPSSMQDQMTSHHQQQQAMLQQRHQQQQQQLQQQQHLQQQQLEMRQQQQVQPQPQQVSSAPFAYPSPSAQATPSAAAHGHSLTPRSFAEAMGIDPHAFSNEISFQLPSFLTGPTVAPGGGGDVIPGSASNVQQNESYPNSWYAGGVQNSHASGYDYSSSVDHS